MPTHEDSLFSDFKRGDVEAWGKLLCQYRPYLINVASKKIGALGSGECSSVVQDCLSVATEKAAHFEGNTPAALKAWLAAIVRHKCVDRHRRRQGGTLENPDRLQGRESTPSAKAIRREELETNRTRIETVVAAIQKLSHDHQQVLHLRFFDDLQFPEIAERMNRSHTAVRSLFVRAFRALKEELVE